VVVASALLVASVVPVLRALTVSQITARRIALTSQALVLAQGRLEWIRARARSDFNQSFTVESAVCDAGYLTTVADEQEAGLRTVTVSVGYDTDENGKLSADEVRVALTTCIAQVRAGGAAW
jgi:hypothetical protein